MLNSKHVALQHRNELQHATKSNQPKHAPLTEGEAPSFFFPLLSDTVNQQSHFKSPRKRSSWLKGERSGSALHGCANERSRGRLPSTRNRIRHLAEPQTVESPRLNSTRPDRRLRCNYAWLFCCGVTGNWWLVPRKGWNLYWLST